MTHQTNAYRIGYCCINLTLPSRFKTTTLSWCVRNKLAYANKLERIYEHNFIELTKVIKWNQENNIWLYRLSSDLNPLADHALGYDIFNNWVTKSIALQHAKNQIREYLSFGGRITAHPGQYVSIGSTDQKIRTNALANLNYHGHLFDLLELPRTRFACINIHASGGTNPLPRINIYKSSLENMPEAIITRLTLEVEDSGFWGVQNLLTYFPEIPIVFDTLHHKCNHFQISELEAFELCATTWKEVPQLIHHSEGRANPTDRRHSDFIQKLPDLPADMELECKMKDLAILQLKANHN